MDSNSEQVVLKTRRSGRACLAPDPGRRNVSINVSHTLAGPFQAPPRRVGGGRGGSRTGIMSSRRQPRPGQARAAAVPAAAAGIYPSFQRLRSIDIGRRGHYHDFDKHALNGLWAATEDRESLSPPELIRICSRLFFTQEDGSYRDGSIFLPGA